MGTPERRPAGPGFDRFAAEYEAELERGLRLSGEDSAHFARERCRWLRGCLERLGLVPRRVLDFGCGTGGAIPHLLAELGAESVVGSDVSAASLAVARRRAGDDRVSFADPAQLPAGGFDLVHVNGVLHHVDPAERPAVLEAIAAALRPGGVLALWENNPWNPGTRLIMSRVEFDRDAIMLSAPAARRLLLEHGFATLRTDFLFVFPRPLAALRRFEPALAALPLGGQYLVLGRAGA